MNEESKITVDFKRADGSFVGLFGGFPYNFTKDDPLWKKALSLSKGVKVQTPVFRNGSVVGFLPDYKDGVLITKEEELNVIEMPKAQIQVSSRQFKLQLFASGLYNVVEDWVASEPLPVRISYENSAMFLRNDKTLASGFKALGYSEEQVDKFFEEAAKL